MRHFLLVISICISIPYSVLAQNEADALRYSYTPTPGTARSMAMGGAFGALGADLTSFWTNPAGIGVYRRNEVTFGIGLNDTQSSSRYNGNESENGASSFRLKNFGVVGSRKEPEGSDWVATNFGFAYAKTRDFNQDITISGSASNTSLLNVFALQGAGVHPDQITDTYAFGSGLAYQCWLINPGDSAGSFYTPVTGDGNRFQTKNIRRRGSSSETDFAFGANYSDKVFIGLGVGLLGINYDEFSTYKEDKFDATETLENFTYSENLQTSGAGVNFKLGFLVRASEWLRVGMAIHSPSYIGLTDSYSSAMTSRFLAGDEYNAQSPDSRFDYNLRTPARFMANAAFILGKDGLIAADYEMVDYSTIRMRSSSYMQEAYDFSAENHAISEIYRATHTAKVGMEWRIIREFRLRAGAGYRQSAFVNGAATNTPLITYSGGIGYRKDQFFAELAIVSSSKDESHFMYDPEMVNPAELKHRMIESLLNIGLRF